MRILIDAHMVGENETGNETYISNLLQGLQLLDHQHQIFIAATRRAQFFDELKKDPRFVPILVSDEPMRRLLWDLPRAVGLHKIDILHVTYTAPLVCRCPIVLSVHDVSFESHPEWFSARDLLVLRLGVRNSIRRARRVITISNHAKSELVRYFSIKPDQIAVTYLAAAPFFFNGGEQGHFSSPPSPPYVLVVGNLQPRKNLVRFINAFAMAQSILTPVPKLIICGKVQWQESEVYKAIQVAGIESTVEFTGYIDNERLRQLYRNAAVFAYPSLYEGFGLPVLEAMACGAPVLTSDCASIPEVAGDAAILMNPYDVEQMAHQLTSLLRSPSLRKSLQLQGIKRAQQFSWENTARETVSIYEDSIRDKG